MEERLDLIHKLKRKYGGSIEAVLAFAENARQQLETITARRRAHRRAGSQEQAGLLKKLAAAGAGSLEQRQQGRRDSWPKASKRELDDLRMAGARFAVDFRTEPDPRRPAPGGRAAAWPSTRPASTGWNS